MTFIFKIKKPRRGSGAKFLCSLCWSARDPEEGSGPLSPAPSSRRSAARGRLINAQHLRHTGESFPSPPGHSMGRDVTCHPSGFLSSASPVTHLQPRLAEHLLYVKHPLSPDTCQSSRPAAGANPLAPGVDEGPAIKFTSIKPTSAHGHSSCRHKGHTPGASSQERGRWPTETERRGYPVSGDAKGNET